MAACMVIAACKPGKKVEKKKLVVYYSITSTTKTAAECIQKMVGADMTALQVKVPYSTDFQEIIERSQKEMKDSVLPELLPLKLDLADYDTIFVGYPIWYGTYALPMLSWLSNTDLTGKVIIPFATFGSGGYSQSVADLKELKPGVEVLEGFGIRSALIDMLPANVEEMLIKLGMKAGELEEKGDFSEQKPVTADEKAIFDEAVKGYEMLNATPSTVGSRNVKSGTEYCFEAENARPDGGKMPVTVFVTKENSDKPAYFTLVDYKQ